MVKAFAATAILCILAALAITLIPFDIPFKMPEIVAFLALSAAIISPYIAAAIQRKFDPLEPVFFVSLLTFVYFVLIPGSLVLRPNGYLYFGVNYRPMLPLALRMALVALVGYYFGYYVGKRRWQPRGLWVVSTDANSARRYAWMGIILATILVVLWIDLGDIPLWALNVFDERAEYGTWYQLSEALIGYLYVARLAYLPLLLLALAYRQTRNPGMPWLMVCAAVGAFYIMLGVRIALLLLLLSTSIYLYLEHGKRPKLWHLIVLAIGLFMFNGFLGIARARGQIGIPFVGLQASWNVFLEGNALVYGICMISFLFPTVLPFQHGQILLSELTLPIPRMLWPEKPGNLLIAYLQDTFSVHYSPAVFGGWYADFGLLGPFLFMALLGVACAYVYRVWETYRHEPAARVLLALTLSLLLIVYTRVNAVGFTWVTFVILPLLAVQFLATRRQRRGAFGSQPPAPFRRKDASSESMSKSRLAG